MILKRGLMRVAPLTLAASIIVVPSCTTLDGSWGGAGGSNRPSAWIDGQIRDVDTRRDRIRIRESWGRTRTVRYDHRTRVVYGRRQYPVSALERGDMVRVRVVYDRNRRPVADRVDVRQSVRDRRGVGHRVERLAGVVRRLELGRGYFTVDRGRSGTVVVRLPRQMRREDARHLRRLRRGDRVRFEARAINHRAVEFIRFR